MKTRNIFLIENSFQKHIAMAEGGEFGYKDTILDGKIDNDDDATNTTTNTSQGFDPIAFSTPYHRGEQHEMQTMQHEQSGLPSSYTERTPLLPEIERFAALRENQRTGIIDTTHMMDASINFLSEEDREKQIERVKRLIKANYPNAKVDSLVIAFSKKRPMDIVALGPRGGETKIVLNDGSALQQSFLNLTYVKKALGTPGREIINQADVHIIKRQEELQKEREKEEADSQDQQQKLKSKDEEIRGMVQRIEKEEAKIDQLKNQGPEEEMARKKQLLKNLKKDLETKVKERKELEKKSKDQKKRQENIAQLQSSISEEERKRNELEENLYSTKTFDALKEEITHLERLNEEDQAVIQDEMATSFDKEAAEERVAARNEQIARLQTQIAEREATMPLRERVREIFKKYGVTVTAIFLAAGVTIGAVVGAITNALKSMGNQLANGLKAVGAKAASALPGLIGAIVSFLFKTAGQAIGYLAEHTWLLILAAVVFIFEKYIKRR